MREFHKIAVLDNEVQAQLLDSALSDRGIPHMMRCYYDSAYDGLFQFGKGWGHVEAPEEHREEILQILADLSPDPPDSEEDSPQPGAGDSLS